MRTGGGGRHRSVAKVPGGAGRNRASQSGFPQIILELIDSDVLGGWPGAETWQVLRAAEELEADHWSESQLVNFGGQSRPWMTRRRGRTELERPIRLRREMRGTRRSYDLAHASFLPLPLSVLILSLTHIAAQRGVLDSSTAASIGFLMLLPSLVSLVCVGIGIVMCAVLTKVWSLVVLAAMSALFIALVADGTGSTEFFDRIIILYAAGTITICAAWLLSLRRKAFETGETQSSRSGH